MLKLAHLIHPIQVEPDSDLLVAQPVTFATMQTAVDFARGKKDLIVSLYAAQYADEEHHPLPPAFMRTPDLCRSIIDVRPRRVKRKLALIGDLLALLNHCSNAEYLIYTNVDIALQPFFYLTVAHFIESGCDAFVINRRTIGDTHRTVDEIPLMYAEIGKPHPGYDCFVFKRELLSHFILGEISIGTSGIGRVLIANMAAFAERFQEFRHEHLTFHIGDSQTWRSAEYDDYQQDNWAQYHRIFGQLEAVRGPFPPLWRSYLLDFDVNRRFPEFGHRAGGSV